VYFKPTPVTLHIFECLRSQGREITAFIEQAVAEKAAREHPDCLPQMPPGIVAEAKEPYRTE
jgi:hypothetical protein